MRKLHFIDLLLVPVYVLAVIVKGYVQVLLTLLLRSYNLLLKFGSFSGDRLLLMAERIDIASGGSKGDEKPDA